MAETLTFSAYAARRGWSQPYVSQLVKAGVIPITADRKIDPDVADAAIAEYRDPAKQSTADRHAAKRAEKGAPPAQQPSSVVPPTGQFQKAKTAVEVFRAKRAEIEYRERVGELVERSRVDAGVTAMCGAIRRAVQLIPDAVATRVAAESDPRKVRAMLMTACEQALSDLADAVAALPEQLTATRQ